MAFDIPGFTRGWIAGGTLGTAGSDLSLPNTVNSIAVDSYRYMFVRFVSGLIVPVTASSQASIVGVLQNKPQPGQPAEVMVSGVTKVRASDASIVVGSQVYLDNYGMVKTAGTATQCIGIAEEVAATALGYVIAVCLKPFGALIS